MLHIFGQNLDKFKMNWGWNLDRIRMIFGYFEITMLVVMFIYWFNILLFYLTLSPYRGLFWFSPILLLSPIGIYYLWRDQNTRTIAFLIVFIAAYYLLLNSSYYYWNGGWSTGPRHLTPIIPFLCLPLSKVWTNARRGFKPILVFIFSTSFLIALMSVSIDMYSPSNYKNPLFEEL